MKTYQAVNEDAEELIHQYSKFEAPVKVENIARAMGIRVIPYPLENDVSGILVIEPDGATIGFNQLESRVRRRFTVAHEIGHYLYHNEESTSKVFVDKGYKVHFRRTPEDEPEAIKREREANLFASCLLMPETLILKAIEDLEFDLGSEDSIRHLAKQFDVSTTAMTYRIQKINI
jgi:Zn-dependent peptidase ImmA (M78 family)